MKIATILLSLAMGATAQLPEGVTTSSIRRATKVVTEKTKRNAASASSRKIGNKLSSIAHPSKDHAAREKRSQRRALGNSLHKTLFNKDHSLKETNIDTKTQEKVEGGEDRKLKKTNKETTENGQEEDRELKKAKSNKGGMGASNWGSPDWSDDGHGGHFEYGGGGKSGKAESWGAGSGGDGKSGKAGSWGGSGKSGKAGSWGGSGKSGKDGGGYGGCNDGYAYVTITNLSFRQSFSEIFVMTATSDVTYHKPIYTFGNRTNDALAQLAQNADAQEMVRRYDNRPGVEQVKVFSDFGPGDKDEHYLRGGARSRFKVRTSGYGHRLSIAVGMPFTNDGAVVLEGAQIYEGAKYMIPAIDVGAEGNIQTCWSVAAVQEDFPPNAECADNDLSDRNDNNIPGENFVGMHRGVHDFDDKKDLEDLLFFPTCKDYDLDKSDEKDRYAQYFFESGYDDEVLLCKNRGPGSDCDYRDDADFLDFIDRSPTFGEDDRFIQLAQNSDDFDDFCDDIDTANKALDNAFKTLEAYIFDWRNDIAHVEIDCGWHGDGHDDMSGDDHLD